MKVLLNRPQSYRGLLVNDGGLSALMGYAGADFSALPDSFKWYILSRRAENPGETDALLNNSDGIHRVSDFDARWSAAVALSKDVDSLRGDPFAASLNQLESGLANTLLDGLERARNYYPWGSVWGRTTANQSGLDAAIGTIDRTLSSYLSQVSAEVVNVRRRIADREAAAAQDAINAKAAAAAAANAAAVASAAAAATSEAQRAQAQTTAYQAKAAELTTKLQYETLQADAAAPKLFGMPLSVVIPVGLAGIAGLFLLTRHHKE